MSERFIKFIPSEAAIKFAIKYKNAFVLLMIIAERARRRNGDPDGLTIGQCHLGNHKNYGMSEKEYRYAKKVLVDQGLIKIVVTNRTRKKAKQTKKLFETTFGATDGATEVTTTGTLVELCNSTIWDINSGDGKQQKGDRKGDLGATEGRLKGDKQEGRRKKKKEKEDHPSIPSLRSDRVDRTDDDDDEFLSKGEEKVEVIPGILITKVDLEACVKLKGSIEKVKHAMEFIQGSKERKNEISNWPNALAKWKIGNKAKDRIEDNIVLAEKLSATFEHFKHGNGWRCYVYTDRQKDQKGLLFENESPYKEPIFIALIDGEFKQKCDEIVKKNGMKALKN